MDVVQCMDASQPYDRGANRGPRDNPGPLNSHCRELNNMQPWRIPDSAKYSI